MAVAKITQLKKLFDHLGSVGSTTIDTFQSDPATYITNNPLVLGTGVTLSNRQLGLLAAGTQLAADFKRFMTGPSKNWIPGAVAVTAGCRPNYAPPTFVASYVGVPADTMPRDPIAAMLWSWAAASGADRQLVVKLLEWIRDCSSAAETEIKGVMNELINDILK